MAKSYISILALAVVIAPASAKAAWTYPGSMCTDYDEFQLKISRHAIYGAYNAEAEPAIVQCAVPVFGLGDSLAAADIYVYNRNAQQALGCWLHVFDAWGDVFFAQYQQTTVSSAALQSFNFDLDSAYDTDFVGFQCSIPSYSAGGYSHVAGYTITN